ncbi:MAG TPA: alpha/beta hydrolase [Roseiflexaceae bacterium]|nr:alpha/beta hydrolase [Roseiflexaceae bacterium]
MKTLSADIVQGYRPLAELVPAHWQAGMIEAEDGTPLYYTRTGGEKPPVLLLHGVQAAGLTWLRTAKAIEATYDVVMPDFRGHGRSGRVGDELQADTLVNDTIRMIGALELPMPFVVGHSMGADIAGRLAAAHPTGGVVLVDPALRNFPAAVFTDDTPPPWMQPIIEAMQALKTQPHAERMLTGLRLLPPGSPALDEADYVSFVEAMAQFDLGFFRTAMRMGYLFEAPEVIARIASPVLLLTARPMMPGADIAAGVAAFKNNWRAGQHIHFADSGHFIPFEQFDRFVEVLTRFMREHS